MKTPAEETWVRTIGKKRLGEKTWKGKNQPELKNWGRKTEVDLQNLIAKHEAVKKNRSER